MAVALCLILPLPLVVTPAYLGLAAGSVMVVALLAAALYTEDPLRWKGFPYWILSGVCAGAVAYSLSAKPQALTISIVGVISVILYAVLWHYLIWRSRCRLKALVDRYQQGEEQRELALQLDLEAGILEPEDCQGKRAYLATKKRYLLLLVEAREAVSFQALGVLALYLVFGMPGPGWLWWSFALSFFLSTSIGMVVSRYTYDPNLD